MAKTSDAVLLVGSVPLETAEQVFRICAQAIGDCVVSIPDGEVGDRTIWVVFQAYRVFYEHPQLKTLRKPEGGKEWWIPKDLSDMWLFKVKDGVSEVWFDDLQYARHAVDSYRTFCALREQEEISKNVRFQVCLPTPMGGFSWFFHNPADHLKVGPAYEAAMIREVEKIVAQIPAKDLAIQWDVCWEVLDIEGIFSWSPAGDPWQRYVEQTRRLSRNIPEDALVGYHYCYADLGHRHMKEPQDLGLCVRMANAAVAETGRRVDWVHMPVPRSRNDEAYFAPLPDLQVGDTRVYLGLIHHTDGLEGTQRRLATAKKYLSNFGVATECGFGRREPETLPELLQIHKVIADSL